MTTTVQCRKNNCKIRNLLATYVTTTNSIDVWITILFVNEILKEIYFREFMAVWFIFGRKLFCCWMSYFIPLVNMDI